MDIIPLDIWNQIVEFIKTNKEKCYLMMTCKEISKCHVYFYDIVMNDKILKSKWFNNFTSILVKWDMFRLPMHVTHLTFGSFFNQPVDGYIPYGVTHLKFGGNFNRSVYKLPSSVTHLELGCSFKHSIENIPSSVTHLTCDKSICTNIPSTVTHLFVKGLYNIHESSRIYEQFNRIDLVISFPEIK